MVLQEPPAAPPQPRTPSILLDSAVLLAVRGVFFLLSRRYLLASLSPTLRELQRPAHTLPTDTGPRSTSASGSTIRTGARTPDSAAVALQSDLDDEWDDTPDSSYPPSPRNVREPLLGEASASGSTSSAPIELNVLGAKLRDTSRVLELSHAHGTRGTRTKRTARELTRVARWEAHVQSNRRVLFSLCFAESLNLITVVVFHALGILHAHSRRVNFSVSLHIMLALVLIVVPLMQCMLFTYRSREPSSVTTRSSSLQLGSRVLVALIPFSLYMFLFTLIPPYITAIPAPTGAESDASGSKSALDRWTSGPEGWESGGWLAPSLGRVVVLGVLVIAGLSGMGAVVTAWDYLEEAAGARRPVTDAEVLHAEQSLYRVRHDIVSKKEEITRVAPNETNSWMGRVFGTKADQEVAALKGEVYGLELMENDIARSLKIMKKRRRSQGFKHTLKGSVYNILGYTFAIYCVARLAMCAISLLTAPKETGTTNGDWISWILALALAHTGGDVHAWSRSISLLLTGLLVISSLAMVLRWLGRVLHLTSRTIGAGFLLLFLGQLFSTYTISLLVQLRTSLPPPEPQPQIPTNGTVIDPPEAVADNSLLRTLPDFRVFGRLFDAVFLLTAIATAVYRYIAMKVADHGELYASLGR